MVLFLVSGCVTGPAEHSSGGIASVTRLFVLITNVLLSPETTVPESLGHLCSTRRAQGGNTGWTQTPASNRGHKGGVCLRLLGGVGLFSGGHSALARVS